MLKSKIKRTPDSDVKTILAKFEEGFKSTAKKIDRRDGIKILLKDGNWVNARPSGTEPIIRIFAEAPTKHKARLLIKQAQQCLAH